MASVPPLGSSTAAYWFQFFLDAGIPPADAGNYAVTFTENRIQQDMIVDLTKEYLTEMGVTVLGDMIAILKHAKRVHTQAAREKFLKDSGVSSVAGTTGATAGVAPLPGSAKKVAVPVRPSKSVVDQATVMTPKSTLPLRSSKTAEEISAEIFLQSIEIEKTNAVMPVKRMPKKDTQKVEVVPSQTTISRLKPIVANEVSTPKVRNTAPEQDCGYKIIYPSSETRKTRTSTSQLKSDVRQSSVFDRLGEERRPESRVESKPMEEKTKVFCRLGEKRELKRLLIETDDGYGVTSKRSKGLIEGSSKLNPAAEVSAGILSGGGLKPDSVPVRLRLGNKLGVSSNGNGQTVERASLGTKPSLQTRLNRTELPSKPIQKITFGTDKAIKRTTEPAQKFSNDLLIQVQNNNPGTAGSRQFGPQQTSRVQPSSKTERPKTNSAIQRLGSQKPAVLKTQPVPRNTGSVMLRLGQQKSTAQKVQSLDVVNVSALVASAKSSSRPIGERWNSKPSDDVSVAGVFSRLGKKKL